MPHAHTSPVPADQHPPASHPVLHSEQHVSASTPVPAHTDQGPLALPPTGSLNPSAALAEAPAHVLPWKASILTGKSVLVPLSTLASSAQVNGNPGSSYVPQQPLPAYVSAQSTAHLAYPSYVSDFHSPSPIQPAAATWPGLPSGMPAQFVPASSHTVRRAHHFKTPLRTPVAY